MASVSNNPLRTQCNIARVFHTPPWFLRLSSNHRSLLKTSTIWATCSNTRLALAFNSTSSSIIKCLSSNLINRSISLRLEGASSCQWISVGWDKSRWALRECSNSFLASWVLSSRLSSQLRLKTNTSIKWILLWHRVQTEEEYNPILSSNNTCSHSITMEALTRSSRVLTCLDDLSLLNIITYRLYSFFTSWTL